MLGQNWKQKREWKKKKLKKNIVGLIKISHRQNCLKLSAMGSLGAFLNKLNWFKIFKIENVRILQATEVVEKSGKLLQMTKVVFAYRKNVQKQKLLLLREIVVEISESHAVAK